MSNAASALSSPSRADYAESVDNVLVERGMDMTRGIAETDLVRECFQAGKNPVKCAERIAAQRREGS